MTDMKKSKGFEKCKREIQYQVINEKGKRGIRTLGTNNSYSRLAICRFKPLSHLSQLKRDNYYVTLDINIKKIKDWKGSFFISVFLLYRWDVYNFYQQFQFYLDKVKVRTRKIQINKKIKKKKPLWFRPKGHFFFILTARLGQYLGGPFSFQWIISES